MGEMGKFIEKYLDENERIKVLDVGSLDVHRPEKKLNFKRFFNKNDKWEYVGLDIEEGRNVDVVTKYLYKYPFPDNSFDVVISGNTLEHVEDLHRIIMEIGRLAKDLVFIVVPNTHPYHTYPIDCWRIFPDGMRFLLGKIAGLEVLECYMGEGRASKLTVGIARKPKQ